MKKRRLSILLTLLMLALAIGCASAQEDKPDLLGDFETTDIYGNAATQSLIRDAKLTFVNVWGTFCPTCIDEMPNLGMLAEEYKDRVRFIGLVGDANFLQGIDQDVVDQAKKIVEGTGAGGITHLIPADSMYKLALGTVQIFPTSFLVDSQGRQVGYAYQGGQPIENWRAVIDAALAEVDG